MRFAPLVTAFAFAAGLVGFSALRAQPPTGKEKKADPDLAALQGEWVVTKVELPPGEKAPGETELKTTRIRVRDDMVTGVLLAPDGMELEFWHGRLTLDSSKAPRQLDMRPVDKNGEPFKLGKATGRKDRTIRAIYKLEAGGLVVCLPDDNGRGESPPRPTAFQAAKSAGDNPAYGVGYLTKKK